MSRLVIALVSGCAITLATGAALADPPGRVGRISDVEGDVSFLPPGQDDWTWADRNFPLTAGESFWTNQDGRVELQAGVMEVRADSDTELDVLTLDYGATRLGLTQGSIDLRLWRLPRGGVTVATPAGDIEIGEAGVYRIDVGAAEEDGSYPPVELTVFEGDAGAPGPEGFSDVEAGEAALIYAGYDPEYADAQDAAIDDWSREREQRERWDTQAGFSASMTGYEDLADQGEFVSDPDYGTVWYPSQVPEDWAPYRFGHWAFVRPWGYTWIDDQSWGFAPFHYGRWVRIEGRWGWVAGQPSAEPVYAPALVAFFGVGASIGWTPLAPDEVYRPTYDVSDSYLRRVNAASVRPEVVQNITINTSVNIRDYRNAGAAVVVGSDTFSRGARVQSAASRVAPDQLAAAAPVIPHTLAPPTPQALSGGQLRAGIAPAARPASPPSRLEAFRASVKAQPAGSNRPPAISGATIAPPRPRPAGAPAFVAPAQVRNPTLQARRPILPPATGQQPGGATPTPRPFTRPVTPQSGQSYERSPYRGPLANPNPQAGSGSPAERPMTRPMAPSSGQSFERPTMPESGQPCQRPPSTSANPNLQPSGAPAERRRPAAPPTDETYGRPPYGARPSNPPNGLGGSSAAAPQGYARPPVQPQEEGSTAPHPRPQQAPFRPNVGPPPGSPAESGRPPANRPATKTLPPEKKSKPKPDEEPPPQ